MERSSNEVKMNIIFLQGSKEDQHLIKSHSILRTPLLISWGIVRHTIAYTFMTMTRTVLRPVHNVAVLTYYSDQFIKWMLE